MEATEHWEGDDVPLGRALCGDGGQLVDPLVRARGVVVADVLGDDALEVPAVEHENVVEAFATKRAQKALADGVHVRRAHRRADDPDAGGACERTRSNESTSASIVYIRAHLRLLRLPPERFYSLLPGRLCTPPASIALKTDAPRGIDRFAYTDGVRYQQLHRDAHAALRRGGTRRP